MQSMMRPQTIRAVARTGSVALRQVCVPPPHRRICATL